MSEDSQLLELLNRARDGDDQARDELFAKCRNYVAVVARAQVESALRSKMDASDLVQQTLLEAHQGLDRFRGHTEGEWIAWLRKLLMNNAADFLRAYRGTQKRQVHREVHPYAATDGSRDRGWEPPDPAETPSQLVMQKERQLELADALAKLAPDYQEVIVLRCLQHLPFDDVAQRMDRSRPAVQMLWMRAIQKLQEVVHA